jgi:hypothetical protein
LSVNMQAQSVCSRFEVSGVINNRLELVITPRWGFASEVVVSPACTWTTTSMLSVAEGCVGDSAQLRLVSTTSVIC